METIWTLERATDAPIAGVCAALGERWGVDPVVVRVVAIVLALCSGIGAVVYGAAWLLLPPRGGASVTERHLPVLATLGRPVQLGLILFVVVAFAASIGHVLPFGIAPAVVVGAAVALGVRSRRRLEAREARAVEPRPFESQALAWQARVADVTSSALAPSPAGGVLPAASVAAFFAAADPVGLYAPVPAGAHAARRPRPSPARRRLWPATLAVLAIVLTGVGIAHALLNLRIGATVYVAAAALVVGAALVAAAWTGRPRGLLALGIVLAVLAPALAFVDADQAGGPDTVAVASLAALPDRSLLGSGAFHYDLSAAPVTADRTIELDANTGTISVVVPAQGSVVVDATVQTGTIHAPGQSAAGQARHLVWRRTEAGGPTLTLVVALNTGTVTVTR